MPVSSFCRSRPRDATRRMSATDSCAAPSQQQQLRRSSNIFTLYNTIAMYIWICTVGRGAADDQLSAMYNILALKWSSHRRQHLEEGRGSTSRRDASCAQHQLRRSIISSVAAAKAGDGSAPRRCAVDESMIFFNWKFIYANINIINFNFEPFPLCYHFSSCIVLFVTDTVYIKCLFKLFFLNVFCRVQKYRLVWPSPATSQAKLKGHLGWNAAGTFPSHCDFLGLHNENPPSLLNRTTLGAAYSPTRRRFISPSDHA